MYSAPFEAVIDQLSQFVGQIPSIGRRSFFNFLTTLLSHAHPELRFRLFLFAFFWPSHIPARRPTPSSLFDTEHKKSMPRAPIRG